MSRFLGTLSFASLVAVAAAAAAQIKASAIIDTNAKGPVIRPEIYGQFAEHLGTGIDGGIWVGPDSLFRTSAATAATLWKRFSG